MFNLHSCLSNMYPLVVKVIDNLKKSKNCKKEMLMCTEMLIIV